MHDPVRVRVLERFGEQVRNRDRGARIELPLLGHDFVEGRTVDVLALEGGFVAGWLFRGHPLGLAARLYSGRANSLATLGHPGTAGSVPGPEGAAEAPSASGFPSSSMSSGAAISHKARELPRRL